MPEIKLQTFINARPQVCFDLSRSIDLHQLSTAHTHEEAVAGTRTGLIGLNEFVTWRAKHLGFWFQLTSKITAVQPYQSFTDEMLKGPFKRIRHQHIFEVKDNGTLMTDIFWFKSPLGMLGWIADQLVLTLYLTELLTKRNEVVKNFAESGRWQQLIK